jgi:hypothetical protein
MVGNAMVEPYSQFCACDHSRSNLEYLILLVLAELHYAMSDTLL